MGQRESLCKRSNHLFDRSGSRPQSPSRVQTLVGIISAMNRAKAMRRRELRGRKAGRLETNVPLMRNNARRTGAEVGAHHERPLFPLASPSRSKSVRPHPERPDRRLFPWRESEGKTGSRVPTLLRRESSANNQVRWQGTARVAAGLRWQHCPGHKSKRASSTGPVCWCGSSESRCSRGHDLCLPCGTNSATRLWRTRTTASGLMSAKAVRYRHRSRKAHCGRRCRTTASALPLGPLPHCLSRLSIAC